MGTAGQRGPHWMSSERPSRPRRGAGAATALSPAVPVIGSRSKRFLLAALLCVSVGLPVVLSVATGSIAIPHNDAWSHSKIAEEFARTGAFELVGWNRAALVGQVVILGPLGSSIIAQQLFVAALSLVALGATYGYLFSRVGSAGALLATAIVAVNPEFGLLATSYMSDIPAFAALMVCLLLTDRALKTHSTWYLAAALVVGVWGFTIREQDLVGPVVAVAVTALAWRGRKRVTAVGLGLIAAVPIVVFELWRQSLPFADPPGYNLDLQGAVDPGIRTAFTMALYVAPAVLLVARPGCWSVRTRWISAGVLVLTLAIAARRDGDVFLGNYLEQNGAYSAAAQGNRSSVIPSWLWLGLLVLACVSLALVVGILLHSGLHLDRTSLLAGLLLILGTVGQAALGQVVHGRSLLPLLPIVCVLILKSSERTTWRLALPVLGLLWVTSIAITANALAFDAARWQAASALQETGVSATAIDAGLEWDGYHATGPAVRYSANPDALGWHIKMFKDSRQCYIISASPLEARTPIAAYGYATYAVFGTSSLWVYHEPSCR